MPHDCVLVTGGGAGIGAETIRAFAAAGCRTCIAMDAKADALRSLRAGLAPAHRKTLVTVRRDLLADGRLEAGDLGLPPGVRVRLTLVNNLGGSRAPARRFELLDWEDFLECYALNLKAMVRVTQACLPHMKRAGWGRIVNVSSVAGRSAHDFVGADYCAAKSAVLGLTRKLARELARYGILVNAVCPGIIATGRIRARWENRSPSGNRAILKQIPLGRLGDPAAVARSILHLGSAENTYITGAVLDINGGLHLA